MWGGSAGGMGHALARPLSFCRGLQEEVKKSFVEPVLRLSTLRMFMLHHQKKKMGTVQYGHSVKETCLKKQLPTDERKKSRGKKI